MGGLGTGLKTINWDISNLSKFEKNFYVEDKRVMSRSDREVDDFRRKMEMKVSRAEIKVVVLFKLVSDTRPSCTQTHNLL
jgi:hypothetical protein